MERDEIIKYLKTSKEEIKKNYKTEIMGIFGSYARGENKKNSDLDILVEFQKGADLFDWMAVSNFLEEEIHCKVDIVSKKSLKNEIKSYIMEDLISL